LAKHIIAVIENHALAPATLRADLMDALVFNGYDVHIISTGFDQFSDTLNKKEYVLYDIGSSTINPIDVLRYNWYLYKALKKIKPTVVLTFTIRPAIYGNLVSRTLGLSVLTNITGIGPLFENKGIAYRIARTIYGFALAKTKKIFFQNNNDKDIFLAKGYATPDRVLRIPGSGVNCRKFFPQSKTVDYSPLFTFLFISRLVKDKGILEFVEAGRILKEKNLPIQCQVVGPFWKQNKKSLTVTEEEVAKWQKNGWIHYLSEAKDVRPFMANADCVVLPSYREGMSNVLLEGAAMARPLITCDTPGCHDIVEDGKNGFLCRVRDASDLAEKMEKMYKLSQEDRQKMGEYGRKKVENEFEKNFVVNAYLKTIEQIT
jgi:glycosyltransferase involved in cell wall biosynthesis